MAVTISTGHGYLRRNGNAAQATALVIQVHSGGVSSSPNQCAEINPPTVARKITAARHTSNRCGWSRISRPQDATTRGGSVPGVVAVMSVSLRVRRSGIPPTDQQRRTDEQYHEPAGEDGGTGPRGQQGVRGGHAGECGPGVGGQVRGK